MAFHVIDYEQGLWRRAQDRADGMPIYGNSHREAAANQVGALGEVVVERLLVAHSVPFEQAYETTHDLVLPGLTIDVKTKDRTVRPLPGYECSVPLYNHEHQRPNAFIFVSLQRDRDDHRATMERFKRAFVVGWCSLEELDRGKVWRAGETDPANGTTFWTDCKNVYIQDLRPMTELLEKYASSAAQR